ncbi:DUF4388 domain-containing protein [Deinococcus enclensis]|uniref:PatA-like N-terminal domain-containing protein n=1 Tax=Deinococcus enclensis TaxID=1049582 RepID=A0ABT9MCW8_9DEIO|nr:DUF4388 domain-containing protein [Deinococcus enclensis]MDP9764408.1 hypothetical protein [Deinococcus enclensis]
MQHTTSLDAFDLLELLLMLAGQGKTGLMQVEPAGAGAAPFLLWLAAGRVQAVTYGPLRGAAALARMLGAPQGQFVFEPGLRVPTPDLDVSLDDLTWQALDAVALPAPDFSGPGRLTAPERVAALACSPEERMVLRRLEAQEPVGEVAGDPLGARVVAKLVRLGLLAPRRTRVARLTLGVTRQVRGAAVLDETILERWRVSGGGPVRQVAVRLDDGQVLVFPVRGGPDVGNALLLPPEVLVRHALRAGLSVLARPA